MYSLILKDLLPQWKSKAMIPSVLCLFAGCYFLKTGMPVAVFMLFIPTYTSYTYASAYDFKYGQERFFLSLPVSRSRWVIARYLSAIVVFSLSIVAALSIGFLGRSLALPLAPPEPSVVVVAFLALSLYLGIAFPAYFAFGYVKSRWINFAVMILVAVVSSLASGASQGAAAANEAMRSGSELAVVADFAEKAMLPVLAASLGCLLASLGISLAIFRKREF